MPQLILRGDIELTESLNILIINGDFSIIENDDNQHAITHCVSSTGNFYRNETIGANLGLQINAPNADVTPLIQAVANSLYLDGFVLKESNVVTTGDDATIEVVDSEKITDETNNLI